MTDVTLMKNDGLEYCNQALNFEKEISTKFIVLGEYLYNIQDQNLFSPQWDSFNEFCTEFKSLSQASISKLLNIYRVFIIENNYPKERLAQLGGWSNLAETLPLIKSSNDAEHWLVKAEVLSRNDLRKEIAEHKTGTDMRDCSHENYYDLRVCRICHDRWRLADSQSE